MGEQAPLPASRGAFIPPVVWDDDPESDGFTPVSLHREPARWHALVDADEPVVTQVADGEPGGDARTPTSSCSKPSLVAEMLDALDLRPGLRVLEIGTGTGWNAALLRDRVGPHGQVTSVEIDPGLAARARDVLAATGRDVDVITGDGAAGHPSGAPYDRVIATASARTVPRAWIEQTRVGGLVLLPWGTGYGEDALTRLEVRPDGSATGRCGTRLSFMRLRQQRRHRLEPDEDELRAARRSSTALRGPELYEVVEFSRAAFTIGLRVPHCHLTVEDRDERHRDVELHDRRTGSWARVGMIRDEHPWPVLQLGPRELWNEVEAAHAWWRDAGRPTPDRCTLTVHPDGTHRISTGRHRWPLEL
ncbi:methyltransferase domain-containing protein [Saccharopolyspora gregorii]|uniref:Protein-L-isoaspartate O-methyltransferase n=1 Tax=Saccharopolyspora gregorii TaxID=33914 RepID=A0ABP6RN54_9PSEU